jgi:hypothetical protein
MQPACARRTRLDDDFGTEIEQHRDGAPGLRGCMLRGRQWLRSWPFFALKVAVPALLPPVE